MIWQGTLLLSDNFSLHSWQFYLYKLLSASVFRSPVACFGLVLNMLGRSCLSHNLVTVAVAAESVQNRKAASKKRAHVWFKRETA